jgi:GalNAc-alpha-(1->4)-GalNAc-alpha-(1->3)-diNAcBac-PP-undecaprenol alpha-1,4-N-acetyl-D-galactosaminyltransferase
MKIIFLIPSLQSGGMERVMSQLLLYFSKHSKFELHLVLYGIKRDVFYEVPDEVIVHKPGFEFNNNLRLWSTIKTLLYIRKTLIKIQPHSILSFGELWNNFVLLASLGLSLPVYLSDRCQPDKSLGKLHDNLRRFLYPKAKGVICQTETAKAIYKKMFTHDNFVVIGNPIKTIASGNSLPKENIVLSVGRLIETKHYDQLIQMFAELNQMNWKLVIVGGDALKQSNKEKLEKLIQDLGMEKKIVLAGKQSDVDQYYNKSKIFAFTSSSEGFPNVIGEAMTAGLPAIAYDCVAGPSDLIEDKNTGFLIPLHDKITYKLKLKKLMDDEDLRLQMGEKAQQKIEKYSSEAIGQQFYKAIIGANTPN